MRKMIFKECLLLLISVLIYSAATFTLKKKRMYVGEHVKIEDYPYLVSITIPDVWICSGAIISKNHILTAAHCIPETKDKCTVRAGSKSLIEGGSVHHIDVVSKHENFTADAIRLKAVFDVAVIKVKEPFKYGATIQPIQLLKSGEETKASAKAEAIGYGDIGLDQSSSHLNKINMPIVDKKSCNETVKSWAKLKKGADSNGLPEGQICAQSDDSKRKYPCTGDAGGPLVVDKRLVGIVSYGGKCELGVGTPTVFSEVAYLRKWIDVPEVGRRIRSRRIRAAVLKRKKKKWV